MSAPQKTASNTPAKSTKKIAGYIKLQIKGGQATAARPVGPALGQRGVNIAAFVKEFNARTAKQTDDIFTVIVTVYVDKSYAMLIKTPPVTSLLKKAAKIEKGSKNPGKEIIGKVTEKQIEEIAVIKMPDLNCYDLETGKNLIRGSARSLGLEVVA